MSALLKSHEPSCRKCFRVCVSAMSGGGGKTFVSLGLARFFSKRGMTVQPFKKGPDFIDSAWLALAAGRACPPLDPFFLDARTLASLFQETLERLTGDGPFLALIEGNRGLFDGLDVEGRCSTAEVAKAVQAPVLLVIDCTKITRTVAPLVQGLTAFDEGLSFCGVILNNVGTERQGGLLRAVLERYTDIPVFGVLPRLPVNPLPERHMGIASVGDFFSLRRKDALDRLASHVAENVNTESLLSNVACSTLGIDTPRRGGSLDIFSRPGRPRIGVIRDACFWFYYEENLQALREEGAELVFLAVVGDDAGAPWPRLDGLYIGGGFPEDYAQAISESVALPRIRGLAEANVPIYAECGGFMLLAEALVHHGVRYPMTGVFPLDVEFCAKPQGLGYVEGVVCIDNPFFVRGERIRGHEFHYSRPFIRGNEQFSLRLCRGHGMCSEGDHAFDGLVKKRVWAAYTHIFAPAVPSWASMFVNAARRRGVPS